MLDKENKRNDEQLEVTNKLLLDMVKNQKSSTKNLIRVFMTTIICYTVLLIAMVIGYFVYESQFEVTAWETQVIQEQEAETDDGGNATVNGGDINYYGESKNKTGDNN